MTFTQLKLQPLKYFASVLCSREMPSELSWCVGVKKRCRGARWEEDADLRRREERKEEKKNLDGEEKNLHKRVDVWSYWFLLKRPFLLLGREVSRWKSGKDSSLLFPSSPHAFLIISLIQHGNGCAHKKMARAAAEVGVWDLPVIGIIAPETHRKRGAAATFWWLTGNESWWVFACYWLPLSLLFSPCFEVAFVS